jgi:hypothetical protein
MRIFGEQITNLGAQLPAINNHVNRAVIEQKLTALEASR